MQKSEIAREILAYLVDHPDAQDTVEGIAEWWLLVQKIKRQTAVVEEALADLVHNGFIGEVIVEANGMKRIHYRVEKSKLEEIKSFLKCQFHITKQKKEGEL